jgi:integrase
MTEKAANSRPSSGETSHRWLALSTAAGLIDVPEDFILCRAVPWQVARVPNRIRFKHLIFGAGEPEVQRFFSADLDALLTIGPRVDDPADARPPESAERQNLKQSRDGTANQSCTAAPSSPGLKGWGRYRHIEPGIYQYIPSGMYCERPFNDGRRTIRSLGSNVLEVARREFLRRKKAIRSGKNPYAKPGFVTAPKLSTVGRVIEEYRKANYPDKYLNPRTERTRAAEARHCDLLDKFWRLVELDNVNLPAFDSYREWRLRRLKQGSGMRTIDCELNTLRNAFRYALRRGLVKSNPLTDRPKYQPPKQVTHCREFMPGDATELHKIARLLLSIRTSEVLGFQLLFTAYTGQRTCEILKLRTDAAADEPGHLGQDGKCLRVWRAKGQALVNPFCTVHEGLETLLAAHKVWMQRRYPKSVWFFPGRDGEKLVEKAALAHALRRLREKGLIKRKVTPHGARAFFVTVRRSQGAPDSQIALEIGHTSGGSTLAAVYGGVPPDWIRGGGPRMAWLPAGPPAWSDLLERSSPATGVETSVPTLQSSEHNQTPPGNEGVPKAFHNQLGVTPGDRHKF